MNNILYYPYINLPRTDWTLRTLLYYENIGSIVPQEYFYRPEKNYEKFMLELVQSELVTPINPMEVLDRPWETTKPFLQLIENNKERILRPSFSISQKKTYLTRQIKFHTVRIHVDKFDENIFYGLEQLGLANKVNSNWYTVERKTANQLMKFLATVIGGKTDRLPTTDFVRPAFNRSTTPNEQGKRETILTSLIPFPEDIDLSRLRRFKERHSELLNSFKNKVELIVLDPNIKKGTRLFDEHLSELVNRKEELAAKMNESQFGNILFGTVCGLIGAYQGLATAETTGAVIGGIPGFVCAVHSALKIERAENVFDQSGLKYLALAEKRLKR